MAGRVGVGTGALAPGVVYRARAPLRLSFGGGGSELPPFVHEYGGVVLNATIGRYTYASLSVGEGDEVVFAADDCDLCERLPLAAAFSTKSGEGEEVRLPLHRAVYNRIVAEFNGGVPLPLHLHTFSDAPVGSGLGTSSTLTVAMLKCFDEALNLNWDEYALAALAYDIERGDLRLSGGYQDHYTAAFGGFNFMEFRANGEVVVNPLRIRASVLAELEYSLVLYFTGVSRASADIVDVQSRRIAGEAAVRESVHGIVRMAYKMKDALLRGRLAEFAAILHESWLLKRGTAEKISNRAIDEMYERARRNGALGGKISGAGGGGFMMLIVDPMRRQDVLSCLPNAETQAGFCHFSRHGAAAWRTAALK